MNVKDAYEKHLNETGDEQVAALLTLAEAILQPKDFDQKAMEKTIADGVRKGLYGWHFQCGPSVLDSIIRPKEKPKTDPRQGASKT